MNAKLTGVKHLVRPTRMRAAASISHRVACARTSALMSEPMELRRITMRRPMRSLRRPRSGVQTSETVAKHAVMSVFPRKVTPTSSCSFGMDGSVIARLPTSSVEQRNSISSQWLPAPCRSFFAGSMRLLWMSPQRPPQTSPKPN